MATKPVDITVPKLLLKEFKWALEVIDNPNSAEDGKPKKYKFKQAGQTRYDLAMAYRAIMEPFRTVEKVRSDLIRSHLDEQAKTQPDATELSGSWNRAAAKEIEEFLNQDVALSIRQVKLSDLDLENNAIPFTAIGILIDTVIVDDTQPDEHDTE